MEPHHHRSNDAVIKLIRMLSDNDTVLRRIKQLVSEEYTLPTGKCVGLCVGRWAKADTDLRIKRGQRSEEERGGPLSEKHTRDMRERERVCVVSVCGE